MAYGITASGFLKPTYEVILEEILQSYESRYPGFRRHESNLLYIQAQANANREEQFWSLLESVYYSRFVITSYGSALDFGVADRVGKRHAPQYAKGLITIQASAGTLVPAGTLVRRADDVQYRILQDTNIPSTSPVETKIQCVTAGEVGNTSARTITELVTSVVGVSAIYNEDPIIDGAPEESDDALKTRFYASLQDSRGSNVPAINSRLRQTSANAFKVRENRTSASATVDGLQMPPHSISATVIGGTDKEIGQALLYTKAAGVDIVGTNSVMATYDGGTEYEIPFTRAQGVTVYIKFTINVDITFLGFHEAKIKEQAMRYINELRIEQDVDYDLLIAKAFDGIPGVVGLNAVLGRDPNIMTNQDIVAALNEKFVTTLPNITITVTRGV